MATTLAFEIDDTSPTVSYSPLGDTFTAPNISAGWNPYFTTTSFAQFPGQIGQGESLHLTSRNGASLSIPFSGTKVQLFGNVTGGASFSLSLDNLPVQSNATNSNGALATLSNLSNDQHVISLTTSTNGFSDSFVVFDKAVIETTVETEGTINQTSIVDFDVSFMGRWSFNDTFDVSAHTSQHTGDSLRLEFQGASILVLGWISPLGANYSVTLDDVTRNFSAKSSFTQRNALLFHGTGLDPNATHTLGMSNLNDSLLALNVDGFHVHTLLNPISSDPSAAGTDKSYPTGTIAALVLAGVLTCLILSAILFYTFVYRPRKRRDRQHIPLRTQSPDDKFSPPDDVMDIIPTASDGPRASGRSFSRWKREVEAGYGSQNLGITFRSAEDDKSSAQKKSSRSSASHRSGSFISSISSWRWKDRSNRHRPSTNFVLDLPAGSSHPYSRASSTQSFSAPNHLTENSDTESTHGASAQMIAQHYARLSSLDNGAGKALSPVPQMARPVIMEIPPRHVPVAADIPDDIDLGSVRENSRRRPSVDQIAVRNLSPQLTSEYARDIAQRSGSPLQSYRKKKEPSASRYSSKKGQPETLSAMVSSSEPKATRRFSDVSRVRFQDEAPLSQQSSSPTQLSSHQLTDDPPSSGARSSFLDFERHSARSERSLDASSSLAPPVVSQGPKSRWSSTTLAQTSDGQSGSSMEHPSDKSLPEVPDISHSNSSASFPFPVSLPLSPALSDNSPRRISAISHATRVSSELGSVPQTISDIDFQHSDSGDSDIAPREHQILPAHPALPATPQSSNFILNRVLGHDRATSSSSYQHARNNFSTHPSISN